MGVGGALRTAVDAWSIPIPSTDRARLTAVQ
ncbi:hypothetical protein AZ54_19610 [Xanthomonas oryzae pv. oryzae PXO86]|nr:hypothetical protein AZ54_19610 [Xanthomonas oryzae pv. oryzae PXO86]